jgi:hypothetical protein
VPDLTVMTWNIQNLFPVGHPDGPATQQEYDDKVAGLAEVIKRRRARRACPSRSRPQACAR